MVQITIPEYTVESPVTLDDLRAYLAAHGFAKVQDERGLQAGVERWWRRHQRLVQVFVHLGVAVEMSETVVSLASLEDIDVPTLLARLTLRHDIEQAR